MTLFEEFRAFIKAKPYGEEYRFDDCHNCALAQFGQAKFPGKYITAGGTYFDVIDTDESFYVMDRDHPLHDELMDALIWSKTFRELSARFEEILA